MKDIIPILLFFLTMSFMCQAQDTVSARYQSIFGDTSTSWFVYYNKDIPDDEIEGTIILHALSSQTMNLYGTMYKLLWYMPGSQYDYAIEEFYPSDALYLRESPDNSKLYFKEYFGYGPYRDIPEILIMDLDLNVGDTLDTHGWGELLLESRSARPLIRIDTIYYSEGRKILRTNHIHRAWGRYPHLDTLHFIEGVGPSFGPFYGGIGEPLSLTCYYRDGEPIYHGSMYKPDREWPCNAPFYIYNGINSSTKTSATIYPNPTMNICNIALSLPSTYKITVISATGSVVHTKEIYGDKTSIDFHGQHRGVYFVTITSNDNNRLVSKIIKL